MSRRDSRKGVNPGLWFTEPPHDKLVVLTLGLRVVLLIVGIAMVVQPWFIYLAFAYGVGEPPGFNLAGFLVFSIMGCWGIVQGGGLVLIGLPRVVAGASTPTMRVLAGALLIASAVVLMLLGFSGSFTKIASPIVLFLELLAFLVFIYPAKRFSQTKGGSKRLTTPARGTLRSNVRPMRSQR